MTVLLWDFKNKHHVAFGLSRKVTFYTMGQCHSMRWFYLTLPHWHDPFFSNFQCCPKTIFTQKFVDSLPCVGVVRHFLTPCVYELQEIAGIWRPQHTPNVRTDGSRLIRIWIIQIPGYLKFCGNYITISPMVFCMLNFVFHFIWKNFIQVVAISFFN